jgi:23S rRNA (pseudouridine1915-N3)-methyltransferase
LKIKVLMVGKTKNRELLTLEREYAKRVRPYCELSMIEVKPALDVSPERMVQLEGERLLAKLVRQDFVVALEVEGRQLSTEGFARMLEQHPSSVGRDLTFLIGGPYGLSGEVKARKNFSLSLSRMTFTHEMARLFLLEQIYRGFSVIHHLPYHK